MKTTRTDLFDPPEKVGDGSADVTETLAADDVAEDTDEAEPAEEAGAFNKLMRLAAVGPFKLAQTKRGGLDSEVAPKSRQADAAFVAAAPGLEHVRCSGPERGLGNFGPGPRGGLAAAPSPS